MNETAPTPEEWKNLYDAAVRFKNLAPWKWMDETEVFGVQDPVGGKVGYCCVMGGLGEFHALAVYLGERGLEGFLKILSEAVSHEEAMYTQECLMASFVGSKDVDARDKALIKQLGLKFRGATAWPEFRSHQPGYLPWYLNRDEALFLTEALEQACIVYEACRSSKDIFHSGPPESIPVRVASSEKGTRQWETQYMIPALPRKESPIPTDIAAVDEVTLQRIKKKPIRLATAWEIDYFYTPVTVGEPGTRPYFPGAVMVTDHQTGMILATELYQPGQWAQTMQGKLKELISVAEVLPAQLIVNKEEVKKLLKISFPDLPSKVKKLKRLPAVDEARASLFKYWAAR